MTNPILPKKFSSLQIYRGIAAILVVLYHITSISNEGDNNAFLGNIFGFGFTGVDFFFVLSGFIIFYTTWPDFGDKQKTFLYLCRRIVRIFPIYWIITLTKLLVILVHPSTAKPYETELGVILKSIFLIPQVNFPVIAAAWTLSYELLFYILMTTFIILGFRYGYKLFLGWAVVITAFNAINYITGQGLSNVFIINFLLNERNIEFLLGCLSAYILLNHASVIRFPLLWIIMGISLFAASGWYVDHGGNIFSYTLFFGLPSFFLVLGSSALEAQKPIRWPGLPVFLGDASYSIYLSHVMFVNFWLIFIDRINLFQKVPPVLVGTLLAILAVSSGCLLYYLLERPIMKQFSQKIKGIQKKTAPSAPPGAVDDSTLVARLP